MKNKMLVFFTVMQMSILMHAQNIPFSFKVGPEQEAKYGQDHGDFIGVMSDGHVYKEAYAKESGNTMTLLVYDENMRLINTATITAPEPKMVITDAFILHDKLICISYNEEADKQPLYLFEVSKDTYKPKGEPVHLYDIPVKSKDASAIKYSCDFVFSPDNSLACIFNNSSTFNRKGIDSINFTRKYMAAVINDQFQMQNVRSSTSDGRDDAYGSSDLKQTAIDNAGNIYHLNTLESNLYYQSDYFIYVYPNDGAAEIKQHLTVLDEVIYSAKLEIDPKNQIIIAGFAKHTNANKSTGPYDAFIMHFSDYTIDQGETTLVRLSDEVNGKNSLGGFESAVLRYVIFTDDQIYFISYSNDLAILITSYGGSDDDTWSMKLPLGTMGPTYFIPAIVDDDLCLVALGNPENITLKGGDIYKPDSYKTRSIILFHILSDRTVNTSVAFDYDSSDKAVWEIYTNKRSLTDPIYILAVDKLGNHQYLGKLILK